jgi:hypothetical protein
MALQQGKTATLTNVESVPTSGGMSKAALKAEMKRLGLRPQAEQKSAEPKRDGT